MEIWLLRHAAAVDRAPSGRDADRTLTEDGHKRAREVARGLARLEPGIELILTSPYSRAKQTAEPFLRLCSPLAEFSAIRGLQPTDPPGLIRDLVAGEHGDVMLVGHMPNLPRVLTLLVTGDESSLLSFPLHGAIALEPAGERWVERWRL